MADAFELPDELPQWIVDHVKLYFDDPERGHMWDSSVAGGPGMLPTLLLFTTGRTSGKLRALPLIYRHMPEGYVIIASKGGAPAHPAWFTNLQAQPECQIQVSEERFAVRARIADGEERQRLWDALVEIYPPYTAYQQATDRSIPVVVLEPHGP